MPSLRLAIGLVVFGVDLGRPHLVRDRAFAAVGYAALLEKHLRFVARVARLKQIIGAYTGARGAQRERGDRGDQ